MSVQVLASPRHNPKQKSSGYYLMELRQHAAERQPIRSKLLINDWATSEVRFIPIQQRSQRLGPS